MKMNYIIIFCLLLQACSFRVTEFGRGPSSEENFSEYRTKMNHFRGRILGSERNANCSKEQLDEDFKNLMAALKKDSCSEENFSIDKNEYIQKNCPKIKTEGLIDRIVKKTIAEEKEEKPLTYFQTKVDPEFLSLVKEAEGYLKYLNAISLNENYPTSERVELIVDYVENVLMPIRDLVVIKRSYLDKENDGSQYYQKLLPVIPQSFLSGLSREELNLLTKGSNPSSPTYMEVAAASNGTYYLGFSAADIFRHDVMTLMKAPTSKNYVLALKWMTLHMMLSQVFTYNTLLEIKGGVQIPKSCQNQFNGNLPSEFNFKFEEGAGDELIEKILVGHGLTYLSEDSSYLDYYLDNVNKNPLQEGYNGLIPFENYKNARVSAQGRSHGKTTQAQFDDVAHFQTVMGIKGAEALSAFNGIIEKRSRASALKEKVNFTGMETFQKVLGTFSADETAEIKLANGESYEFYPGKQNLSPYLLELMQENGLTDYSQLITEKMKKKFVGRKIQIDFPTMYSSPIWRGWSLKVLADLFYKYQDLPMDSDLFRVSKNACETLNFTPRDLCLKGNPVKNISLFLNEFRNERQYIPTRRLEDKQFQSAYPLLGMIWTRLRNSTPLLEEAKPFELNFLKEQMSAGNPWARLKLGYMVALDQLEHQREGIPPVYERNGLWITKNEKAQCAKENVDIQYNKIKEAGKVLGLHYPLSYAHIDTFLSSREKDFIWKKTLEDFDQKNFQLFNVVNGNKNYYKATEDLTYKTLLTKEDALKSVPKISREARQEIETIGKENDAELADFFLKLYKLKGHLKEQGKIFEEFSLVNGIDNDYNIKLAFLAMDNSFKKPLFKDLIRQAASTRRSQLLTKLDHFCGMNINNQVEFKNIFYSTTKAQNELNQLAGLPTVPAQLLEKVNEMSPDEFRDLWWGLGSGVAAMGAIVVGGACTLASGGICLPFAAAGIASIGIQVKLTTNEFERVLEAKQNVSLVKEMENLGFANLGSTDGVHRSYAWTVLDAITIFPLVGVATRSLTLGPKLMAITAKSYMRKTGKSSFKTAMKTASQEEEVRAARYLLGIESVSQSFGLDSKSMNLAKKKIEKIRMLYTSGEIDFETMLKQIGKVLDPIKRAKLAASKTVRSELGKVVVREAPESINRQTAKMVSQYFGNNPKDLLRLIKSYSGDRLEVAFKKMGQLEARELSGKRIPVLSAIRNWYVRMRNEALTKNASKIVQIEKDLEAMSFKEGVLEAYIYKNIDDFTELFLEIPLKKRELPYLALIQGMPEFNFYKGRRIPFLSIMAEGQTMKKIFRARARLVYESYKAQARISLKLKHFVQAQTVLGAFRAFQASVAETAAQKSEQESLKIIQEYNILEEKLTQKLYERYLQSGKQMEYKNFKAMVVNPSNLGEKALADAIWESVPPDELMGMKEVASLAHKAVEELSHYNDIDSFQDYYNALRILVINRNPAVLDIL
jgi:hypothetical protein